MEFNFEEMIIKDQFGNQIDLSKVKNLDDLKNAIIYEIEFPYCKNCGFYSQCNYKSRGDNCALLEDAMRRYIDMNIKTINHQNGYDISEFIKSCYNLVHMFKGCLDFLGIYSDDELSEYFESGHSRANSLWGHKILINLSKYLESIRKVRLDKLKKFAIIVEGESDEIILKSVLKSLRVLGIDFDIKNSIKFYILGGKSGAKKDRIKNHLKRFKELFLDKDSLVGYDIDRTMVRIAVMNLMMHGITNPNINREDTLSKRYNEKGIYDLILANPPFKGSINESEKSDDLTISTSKTELLFLELMYNALSIGGRCAVIVPDGVLFGNSNAHKSIRKLLLEKCRLDAMISMPSGIFKPYAGVSTAVLFFTKTAHEPTKKVWFYDMQTDGFSLDDKRNEIVENDIPDILEKFENRDKEDNEDRAKKHFFVPFEEIKENSWNLSINHYKKEIHEEINHRESKKIIKEAKKEIHEILGGFEELEKI